MSETRCGIHEIQDFMDEIWNFMDRTGRFKNEISNLVDEPERLIAKVPHCIALGARRVDAAIRVLDEPACRMARASPSVDEKLRRTARRLAALTE